MIRTGHPLMTKVAATVTVAVAIGLSLVGCASAATPQIATAVTGEPQATRTPTSNTEAGKGDGDPVKFTKCLRENGVDIPDIDPMKGSFSIPNAEDPAVQAALEKCKPLLGAGAQDGGGKQVAVLTKLAACMRKNGYPNFPDPDAKGGLDFPADLDVNDSKTQEMMSKCSDGSLEAK